MPEKTDNSTTLKLSSYEKELVIEALAAYIEDGHPYESWYLASKDILERLDGRD